MQPGDNCIRLIRDPNRSLVVIVFAEAASAVGGEIRVCRKSTPQTSILAQ